MKLIIVKPIMTQPRYHFDRTIEISKYMDVQWLIGGKVNENEDFSQYVSSKHQILMLGKGKIRRKLLGRIDLLRFIIKAITCLSGRYADLVMVHSSEFSFLYPLFCRKHTFVMLTFTPDVSPSMSRRFIQDIQERIDHIAYRNFIVANEAMIKAFHLECKSTYIMKWGMRPISRHPKLFDKMRLLYIGTLSSRGVHKTVYGLREYMDSNPKVAVERYDIIGTGRSDYLEMISSAINECNLNNIVFMHGYLTDDKIVDYFMKSNVGVAFVPITDYYKDLYVTKSFEYLLSGIPIIATDIIENRKIVFDNNGVLITDSNTGFADGLHKIAGNFSSYDSEAIYKSIENWNLEYTVKHSIVPSLMEIVAK